MRSLYRIGRLRITALLCAAIFVAGCAHKAPPNFTPAGQVAFYANQAAVALGTVQHAAIELNKIQVCDPKPCHALLSDANTRVVVDAVTDALSVLKVAPGGWKTTVTTALDRITARLDAAGQKQIAAYLQMARGLIGQLARATVSTFQTKELTYELAA